MTLGHARALGPAKNVQRSDEEQTIDLLCNRRIEDATHQNGVKMKIRVWHTNHIYDRGDAPQRISDGLLVIRIPDSYLRQRIATEHLLQGGPRPTDHAVLAALLSQRRGHTLADRPRRANESYFISRFQRHDIVARRLSCGAYHDYAHLPCPRE